jgi:hypothetical protein
MKLQPSARQNALLQDAIRQDAAMPSSEAIDAETPQPRVIWLQRRGGESGRL